MKGLHNMNINSVIETAIKNKQPFVSIPIDNSADVKAILKNIPAKFHVKGIRTINGSFLCIYF
jgi:hypothetical protein